MKNVRIEEIFKRQIYDLENKSREPISLSVLTDSLSDFADEYFRGAFEITRDFDSSELVRISPEGLAHFLKLLLGGIYGKGKLMLKISLSFPYAVFKISGCDLSFVGEGHIRLAEQSGFSLRKADPEQLIITADVIKSASLFVYAISSEELTRRIMQVFFG